METFSAAHFTRSAFDHGYYLSQLISGQGRYKMEPRSPRWRPPLRLPPEWKLFVWRMKWARCADRVSILVGVPVSRKKKKKTSARILHIFTIRQHDWQQNKHGVALCKTTLSSLLGLQNDATLGGKNFVTQWELVRMWVNEMRHANSRSLSKHFTFVLHAPRQLHRKCVFCYLITLK